MLETPLCAVSLFACNLSPKRAAGGRGGIARYTWLLREAGRIVMTHLITVHGVSLFFNLPFGILKIKYLQKSTSCGNRTIRRRPTL